MARNVILGLNSAGFVTSSALVIDGKIHFAVEEERLDRQKRSRAFPMRGIREALKTAGLRLDDVDAVTVAWNPAINLEAFSPAQSQRHRYLGEILYNVPNHLMSLKPNEAADYSRQIISFSDGVELNIYYIMHHLAHASAFFFSPFEEAAIMAIDAFGEKHSTVFCEGKGNKIRRIWSQEFPHSLGSFYASMTEYLGFRPKNDEWKVMGASSYGDPQRYYEALHSLFHLKEEGGFELDLSYFNHYQFHRPLMYHPKLAALVGLPPNEKGRPLNQDYYDFAAAAQRVTEDIYCYLIGQLHERTGLDNLVLSGGVVYNSVANGKVLSNTPFQDVFVPPMPDDSGGSLGSAYYLYHQIQDQPRTYTMTTNYFGPGFSDEEIRATLDKFKIRYQPVEDPADEAAALIQEGKILGWFQNRIEFGDRALGNRSILADPRDPSMKDKVNETVKYREPFRPFAPSVLKEHVDEYFVNSVPTPYMEKVLPIRPEKQEEIPAVTHVDGSGRLHTVTKEQNPLYYRLIDCFRARTGVPLVLNTSFNLKGEPIVCSPQDAIRTFFSSGLDALIIGKFVVHKGTA
ncbi:MAG: carbamoyltransferase C-terminal domain-containing protein [Desulfobacteraceae bacterium]|jgi:carbamoyltransferase